MNKLKLSGKITAVARQMELLAAEMVEHGGETATHGQELLGAAKIAHSWSKQVRNQLNEAEEA